MCTDENEEEELTKMYGPMIQAASKKKKNVWYGIMNEFDCEVSSTWSVCGEGRAEAFTHRHLRQDKKEQVSQLEYIIGPMRRNDEVYIPNAGRLWALWDRSPSWARIQEETHTNVFQKRNKGGRAGSRQQKTNH